MHLTERWVRRENIFSMYKPNLFKMCTPSVPLCLLWDYVQNVFSSYQFIWFLISQNSLYQRFKSICFSSNNNFLYLTNFSRTLNVSASLKVLSEFSLQNSKDQRQRYNERKDFSIFACFVILSHIHYLHNKLFWCVKHQIVMTNLLNKHPPTVCIRKTMLC